MPVEFWDVYRGNPQRFGVLEAGEPVDDTDGRMRQFIAQFDDIDWTDVEALLRRFDGPTVVANATGEDATKFRQRESSPVDIEPSRAALAWDGVTYREVDGQRHYDARSLYIQSRAGQVDVVDAGDGRLRVTDLTDSAPGESVLVEPVE